MYAMLGFRLDYNLMEVSDKQAHTPNDIKNITPKLMTA